MKMRSVTTLLLLLCSSFVYAQELKLWYNQPAVKWTEALPVGNGRIGAMVFGGIEKEHIQFNEETLWTGGPRNYNRPGAYQYLDTLRQLLFHGDQAAAEALAEKAFMGLKSNEDAKESWVSKMKASNSNDYPENAWKTMKVPSYDGWEAVGFDGLDGAVWLRRTFELSAAEAAKELVLDLNRIRDEDFTYVNGKLVGSRNNTDPRKYKVPAGVLHAGTNTVAVLVLNFTDKGGITGYKDTSRHIGLYLPDQSIPLVSLHGQWKYYIVNDEPPAVGKYQANYLPFGDIFLTFNHTGTVQNYKRSLDLSTATANVTYNVDGTTYAREYLVSQPDKVLAMHLTASRKGAISTVVRLGSSHRAIIKTDAKQSIVKITFKVREGVLTASSTLFVKATGGKVKVLGDSIEIQQADAATIYVAAATSYVNYSDCSGKPEVACQQAIRAVSGKTFEQVKAAHIREYQPYFNTFAINFGTAANDTLPTDTRITRFTQAADAPFVALYMQYARYLLISASRQGTQPANLQGIWNDQMSPPWGSKYTTNINLEMNYWPAELLNLSPMQEPLFHMIDELMVTGHNTAQAYYNAPGWVLHHNTDLWRGTAPINASNHGIWVAGAAWLCQHLWEHYLFTQDTAFLRRRAYPAMKQAAEFFNAYLVKDPATGWLVSGPSNSPEHGGLVMGPTMDHQIIRNLFKDVIAAGKVLGVDKDFGEILTEKYKRIAPNQIGKYGQLQEWLTDSDDPQDKHRHVSHLWGLYPGNEINMEETPELVNAARQSLLFRGDAATGWSLAWKINFWARFKDAEHAYKMIGMLLTPASSGAGSYPNLFDAHPPFQIDGNFGGAAGMAEMLLQSHTRYIDILPALPAEIPDGTVKGICARGGFVIDMEWKKGVLENLKVRSKAGQPLVLRYKGKVMELATTENGVYCFNGQLEKI
ncbi:glycoside hydrolase N-terminal domain-containing protein [Chitinophaga sp. Cy-1792]|uniref:glycoside hydrolase family 95 protein n=1 Tax=Chitinophaga sp. Cy-1792 TaxID=2608339 RepID=UPI001422C308|nr:glycoside hydrolase N-terminal domain-containing protein [Chitinophaga sp. Cy-1792]NIG55330.1 glycoside hydrolase family 95 protein [Chitinophaga sp. Cy-1792]